MPIIRSPREFNVEDLYVDLREVNNTPLYLKCEGFNFAGSIKLKAAVEMVDAAERVGLIRPDSILIESSSGNLGIALAIIAADRGYRFICVTDSRCNAASQRLMRSLGAEVRVIRTQDANLDFLRSRIGYVRDLCASDDRYVWLNQYANPNNWWAHYEHTAPAIARSFPNLEVLFVGSGTTGSLMGCARFFKEHGHPVTIVAVDAVGSVTFGGTPERRVIPGLGTSVRPELLEDWCIDDVVHVAEPDTIRVCHSLAARGFVFGGSTGTVVSGATQWLDEKYPGEEPVAVAISPDFGERYLNTIYDQSWLRENFGETDFSTGSRPEAES